MPKIFIFGSVERTPQKQQFISLTCKKLKGLLLGSLTSLAKLFLLLFWAKLHLGTKTLENVKKISNEPKMYKRTNNVSRQVDSAYI